MARILDDRLDRLKAEIAVERLAESMGVVLKRHGADLLGLCPFHDDREPSPGHQPENEPVALPGCVPDGRLGDRLGDEGRGRVASGTRSSCCWPTINL